MDKQLIILVVYVNLGSYTDSQTTNERFKSVKNNINRIVPEMGDQYNVQTIIMPINTENRVECIFPKDYDSYPDVKEKITELLNKQNELLCQQPQ